MTIELTPDNERFLAQEVAIGAFTDRAAAVNAAVALLKERKALLARLDQGRRQLDKGEYKECDPSRTEEYVEEVHQRGLARTRREAGSSIPPMTASK
jgi:Arc/MetJ-type ribon-helix-helix transcriptional regulator